MQPELNMKLTRAEKEIVELLRALEYGELRVMVKDSNPIRVEEIRRSIQLTARNRQRENKRTREQVHSASASGTNGRTKVRKTGE